MLDNTLIVYLSDAGEKHARSKQWPFGIIGVVADRLRPGGRCSQYPSYRKVGHRTIANLCMTLAAAAGIPLETFGQLDPNLDETWQRGALTELLS